ncbi:MAG: carboxypeptidase regulatory-like domain-containing protein, partial [Planctomycetota bacterium JB042]
AEGETADVAFEPALSGLRGRVTDPTGRGIRAKMHIRTTGATPGPWNAFATDDAGRFVHFRSPGPVLWTVEADGFGTEVLTSTIADADSMREERVTLRPEARLTVRVEDVAGTPVADAAVSVVPSGITVPFAPNRQRPLGSGRWAVRRIAAGSHSIRVSAPGFGAFTREMRFDPGDRRTLRVTLRHVVDLRLTVVDEDGAPIPHTRVRLEPEGEEDDGREPIEATTDAHGALQARLPEGPYRLVALDQSDLLDLTGDSGPVEAVWRLD